MKEYAALIGFTYVKERTEKAANGEIRKAFFICKNGYSSSTKRNFENCPDGGFCSFRVIASRNAHKGSSVNVRLEKLTHNHELNSRAKMFSRNATALNALDKREIYLLSKSNVEAAEIARYINETTGKYISNKQVFNNLALSSCSNLILLEEINQLFSFAGLI